MFFLLIDVLLHIQSFMTFWNFLDKIKIQIGVQTYAFQKKIWIWNVTISCHFDIKWYKVLTYITLINKHTLKIKFSVRCTRKLKKYLSRTFFFFHVQYPNAHIQKNVFTEKYPWCCTNFISDKETSDCLLIIWIEKKVQPHCQVYKKIHNKKTVWKKLEFAKDWLWLNRFSVY